MTHDELLKELDDVAEFADYDPYPRAVKALRAVVELHKQSKDIDIYDKEYGCVGCGVNGEYGTWNNSYPCPTIQAIEKELR